MKKLILFSTLALAFVACRKDTKTADPTPDPAPTVSCPDASCIDPSTTFTTSATGPYLIFKFKFDSAQARLNSFGMPATVPSTNAAFSPVFNGMSAHYIELAQDDYTQVGAGSVLYKAPETSCGGSSAIIYCQSVVVKDSGIFFMIPFSSIPAGTYKWLRISLAYQNYDIPFRTTSTGTLTQWGTVASFIGYNTYVTKYKIKNQYAVPTASVGGPGNHKQGYWGFEFPSLPPFDGQPPAGATTVVNPNPHSIIPPGSCLVTGEFYNMATSSNSPITITGTETINKTIIVSLSTNKSFEWKETNFDGYFQPDAGEFPVDMGIRGMIPKY
jgi:hypothetical protein